MKLTYERGQLRIPLWEVLLELTDAERQDVVEALSCNDSVIKFVTQQIVDGCTENGYFGGKLANASAEPATGLDWACRRVAMAANDVARKEIERLQEALAASEKKYHDLVWEREDRRRAYP